MAKKKLVKKRRSAAAKRKPVAKTKGRTGSASRKRTSKMAASSKRASSLKAQVRRPKTAAAASERDGVFKRMLNRAKHLFNEPLDPRIRHLVEVFGEEAVAGLIAAFRKSRIVADNEIADAIARGEAAMGPSPHGSWAWHELMTTDVAGAKRFYSSMFGWDAYDIEMMPGFNYTLLRHMGRDVGGLMGIGPEHGDMPSGWGVYIAVDDVDAAAEKSESLGGEVIVPPHDIPVGRWAMVKDPAGAMLCLYRSKPEVSAG